MFTEKKLREREREKEKESRESYAGGLLKRVWQQQWVGRAARGVLRSVRRCYANRWTKGPMSIKVILETGIAAQQGSERANTYHSVSARSLKEEGDTK